LADSSLSSGEFARRNTFTHLELVEFLRGNGFCLKQLFGALKVVGVHRVRSAGALQLRGGSIARGLGECARTGVEQRGVRGINYGDDGLRGGNFCAGFEGNAAKLSRDGRGHDVTMADARLAFLADAHAELALGDLAGFDRRGLGPEANDKQRHKRGNADIRQPAARFASIAIFIRFSVVH
jgi:hypothetical protein